MRADDPNYEYLLLIADALGDLRNDVIFVGGSTAGLLLTDPAAASIRATKDVDAIVEAATLQQYYELENRLPAAGFVRDVNSDVICRWRHHASGVLFDQMPIDPAILGFSNRWYPEAARTAVRVRLSARIEIRMIAAPGTSSPVTTWKMSSMSSTAVLRLSRSCGWPRPNCGSSCGNP